MATTPPGQVGPVVQSVTVDGIIRRISVNGVNITNPTDFKNVATALQRKQEVEAKYANVKAFDPLFEESFDAEAAAFAAITAAGTAALNNARAAPAPSNSSGQTTAEAQRARDDGANRQTPPGPPLTAGANGRVQSAAATTTPTNARPATTTPTAGTNAPTRPSSATQAVPPPTATPNAGQIPGNYPGTIANLPPPGPQATGTRTPGVAAGIDDTSNNEVLQRLQTIFSGAAATIPTQPNALSRYSSYTYNIGLYILKPEQYNTYITSKRITIPNGQLLMASGGAPLSANSQPPTNNNMQTGSAANRPGVDLAAGRSQYFPLDFYIDDVKLSGIINGKGSRSAHNVFNINFKITEPNGISLLDNLYKATEEIMGEAPNYAAQIFLMVINFWGYDENGTLTPAMGIDPNDPTKTTIPIVKYIPFVFQNIKFRVSNKLTEYTCEAIAVQNSKATGQALGTIPYNVELTAETMRDIFNGASVVTTAFNPAAGRQPTAVPTAGAAAPAGAPPKAGAAPKETITSGIIQAMNDFEELQIDKGIFEHANIYEVVFTDSILADAKLVPPGATDKTSTPMGPNNATPSQQLNPAAGSVNNTAKNNSATAGTTLIQFMDKTLSASSYIIDQQNAIIDPESGDRIPQRTTASIMGWYRIGLQAVPIAYDPKRNDYAYKITYQVSPYLVNDIKNPYFPQGRFRGVQKSYKYWFTGENTEVLDYNADFNFIYYTVVNSKQEETQTSDYRYAEYVRRRFQTKSNENIQSGTSEDVTEPAAQAKDNLYSPGDLNKAHLTILGDPAWIQQGELGTGITGPGFNYNPYLPDGTINVEAEEVLFEIAWNKPVDYNLETGLMEPGQRIYGANDLVNNPASKQTTQSYIYKAVTVNSMFSKGKFTQELEGVRVLFPTNSKGIVQKNDKGAEVPASPGQADSDLAEQQLRAQNSATAATSRTAVAANYPGAIANPNVIATPAAPLARPNPAAITNRSAAPPDNPGRTAPAPAAKPPTSGGAPVGAANPVTPTNAQTGGTQVTEKTQTTYDEEIFRTKDPESFAKFEEYRQQQFNLIFQSEKSRLALLAAANNPLRLPDPALAARIVNTARSIARLTSDDAAITLFEPQIKAAGAGGTTTTTTPADTTPVNTTAGQPMNRQT
jgi:hypothetical protein